MGCGSSGSARKKAIAITDKRVINTWAAGGKKDQGWTQITFEQNARGQTCKGSVVTGQGSDKVTVFNGEAGTWKILGAKVVITWTAATKDGGKKLSDADGWWSSTLCWNGANGCSLIWCFDGKRQALFPTDCSKSSSEDHYYGGYDNTYYDGCYGGGYGYYGNGSYNGAGCGGYYVPDDPNDAVVVDPGCLCAADGGQCAEDDGCGDDGDGGGDGGDGDGDGGDGDGDGD